MTENIDIKGILDLLPHRYPLLLVDRVVSYELGKSITAYKNLTFNEDFFQGHFPGEPVMPGVLILEALAQAGGVLFMMTMEKEAQDKLLLFFGIDKAKFRRPVIPGDRLDLEVKVVQSSARAWKFHGVASVDGKKAAEADFMAGSASR